MYARFFRWASDRLDINGDGIIAFITNRSFIDRRTFDGFRKCVAQDFNEIWIVDLGGDVRANPKLSGTTHNVFGIQTGVAISFFMRRKGRKGCVIRYARRPEEEVAEDKLAFLAGTRLEQIEFEEIRPDKRHSWINQSENDFEAFLPIADKLTKATENKRQERAIFKQYSLGISTNRDDWLYDDDETVLTSKVKRLVAEYGKPIRGDVFPETIKWSETLKRRKKSGQTETFAASRMRMTSYRPFTPKWLYQSELFIDRPGLAETFFPEGESNLAICFSDIAGRSSYCVLAIDGPADLHFGAAIDAYQQVARYRYIEGERVDNITDWALNRFHEHYEKGKGRRTRPITKDAIFHYTYAVLHDPIYREQYAQNLKREFARLPFYPDFWTWADWGEVLMKLHVDFEEVPKFSISRTDTPDAKARANGVEPKPILRSEKDNGLVFVDSETTLSGVPAQAWSYVLGNRSAIDWVLDQHKEKLPRDPVIRKNFNTYRFADHKEEMIDLLRRVTTVSVETMKIVDAMLAADRGPSRSNDA